MSAFASAIVVAVLLSPAAYADTPAMIQFASGDVEVQLPGKTAEEPVSSGAALPEGSTVETRASGVAIVKLPDGSLLKLNHESRVVLDKIQAGDPVSVALVSGGVFAKVTKQRAKFSIRTHAAVMGVRGTEFFTSFSPAQGHESDVWMCVNEGEVEVSDVADDHKAVVKKGEGVLVPTGKPVTPPKPYLWTSGLNWNMDPGAGDVTDHAAEKMGSGYRDLLKQDYD